MRELAAYCSAMLVGLQIYFIAFGDYFAIKKGRLISATLVIYLLFIFRWLKPTAMKYVKLSVASAICVNS